MASETSEAHPILERLAGRVRSRRQDLALTLRELGARAGVSERFLVLLEGGSANVSVTRLEDIARALGTTAADLLADRPFEPAAPPSGPVARGLLVALLGLRGAGKTTVGAAAAQRLGVPFVELDERVAERSGTSLSQLFELHGVQYYRRLEREALERLVASGERAIVATSGGLVAEHPTFDLLRRSAVTVWLKAKPQDHWSRVVAQGDARPMADRSGAMNELRALLRARRALYERADHVVDTSALGLPRAIDRVVKIAREAGTPAR
jgi:XRE family transcriptional regulator, aerobic/anaerobic benzoate catabolism transcriptional regulator